MICYMLEFASDVDDIRLMQDHMLTAYIKTCSLGNVVGAICIDGPK